MSAFAILAHRGLEQYAPENTPASFAMALEHGLDIELDVALARDGHLVVIHDDSVDRTTDGSGLVADLTLGELKELDAGSWFRREFRNERIPTLREALELVRGRALLALDFKNTLHGAEDKLVECLNGYDRLDRTFVFDLPPDSAARIKTLNPAIPVAARANGRAGCEDFHDYTMKLFSAVDVVWAADTHKRDGEVPPGAYYITREMVELSHAGGKRIYAVVVDNPARWRELIDMGIDGICTRRPLQLKKIAEARGV